MKLFEPSRGRYAENGRPYHDNPKNLPYDNQGRLVKRVRHKD